MNFSSSFQSFFSNPLLLSFSESKASDHETRDSCSLLVFFHDMIGRLLGMREVWLWFGGLVWSMASGSIDLSMGRTGWMFDSHGLTEP